MNNFRIYVEGVTDTKFIQDFVSVNFGHIALNPEADIKNTGGWEKLNLFKMNRRNFTQLAGVSSFGLFTGASVIASNRQSTPKNTFNLAYAPHLGMFRHHAGNDPIDQLNFMADQGFTAFEDNGMRKINQIHKIVNKSIFLCWHKILVPAQESCTSLPLHCFDLIP